MVAKAKTNTLLLREESFDATVQRYIYRADGVDGPQEMEIN